MDGGLWVDLFNGAFIGTAQLEKDFFFFHFLLVDLGEASVRGLTS